MWHNISLHIREAFRKFLQIVIYWYFIKCCRSKIIRKKHKTVKRYSTYVFTSYLRRRADYNIDFWVLSPYSIHIVYFSIKYLIVTIFSNCLIQYLGKYIRKLIKYFCIENKHFPTVMSLINVISQCLIRF